MSEFWKALELVNFETPVVDLEYRLYYNTCGTPLFYTCEKPEGTYIEVSKEEYERARHDVIVKDGKICYLNDISYSTKLVPSDYGTSTHPENILLIDSKSEFYWSLKTYYID